MAGAGREPRQVGTRPTFLTTASGAPRSKHEERLGHGRTLSPWSPGQCRCHWCQLCQGGSGRAEAIHRWQVARKGSRLGLVQGRKRPQNQQQDAREVWRGHMGWWKPPCPVKHGPDLQAAGSRLQPQATCYPAYHASPPRLKGVQRPSGASPRATWVGLVFKGPGD